MMSRSVAAALGVTGMLFALVLPGCSGEPDPSAATPTAAPTTTATAATPTAAPTTTATAAPITTPTTTPTPSTATPAATPTGASDDHVDDFDTATAAAVGESVEGVVNYEGDQDWFVFDAEAGQTYEVAVTLGSLPDSTLEVQDAGGRGLASNDDYDNTLASRLIVDAPGSGGSYYVLVGGFGTGSYTLRISPSDLTDDHGSHFDTATAVTVGESVQGAVDYDGDWDWFTFEAQEGQTYEIDIALGTLPDSWMGLFAADGEVLAVNDDYGETLASRITLEAPSSGTYYAIVGGWFGVTGSYTLAITGQ